MNKTGASVFRTLRSAAIILCAASVACEREPSAPESSVAPESQVVPTVRIPRARVIEPGDDRIANPPGVDAWSTAGIADPVNMAFDAKGNRYLVFESSTSQLAELRARPDLSVDRLTITRTDARRFGIRTAQGLTVDPRSGRVYVLDGGARIVGIDPDPAGGFERATLSSVALPAALSRARGIAFDPTSGHLHVLDAGTRTLYEISPEGRVVAKRDVSRFRLDDLRGMTVGPTGDATDDPSATGVYIGSGDFVTELALVEIAAVPPPSGSATVVRTTLTSSFSRPSPDPSGIAYASHQGHLVIVDGEVDEMSIYAGSSAFEATLAGSMTRSWATTAFSKEPVGAAYNPANRHLFISDDDRTQVNIVQPGPDGRYGTSDDAITLFDTAVFGCSDPEGLAFDVSQNALFIADGVNAQVFRVTRGPNGIFDGVPPAGDDQVSNFDTQVHGLLDPEGIAYDPNFGHLYLTGEAANVVFQFTTSGAFVRTIDIGSVAARKPAGLEYAPRSTNPSAMSLYIVDRGVDNNDDPNENDGKMYELALPPFSGNVVPTVTITAPANGSSFFEDSPITFTGSASDAEDGNLTASIVWTSSIDGALGTGGSVSTSTLSLGTHTIVASVTDAGGAQAMAQIGVTVNAVGTGFLDVRVAAGSDDAEEDLSTGTMFRGSSDLELVNDGFDQAVGLRFNNITIPPGAVISRAYVQFQVDEATSTAASLTVRGEASDNAVTFVNTASNISLRPKTTSAVTWSPAAWTVIGQAGVAQQTPSIAPVVQQIVNRAGWRSGNSLVIILTGTGRRVAEAFEGLASAAPLLHVEYSTGPNTAPTASNVSISGTPQVGQVLTGNYTYSDTQGDPQGASLYRWLRDGTAISGATALTYTLTTSDLGTRIRFEVTPVATSGASPGTAVQSPEVGPVVEPPPNMAPVASNVAITGTAQVTRTLTGSYTYSDAEGNAQGTSTYRWLRNGAPIAGATTTSYTLGAADQGAMIAFEVTPVAVAGTSPGAPAQSAAVGPVAPPPVFSATLSTVTAAPVSIPAGSGLSTITVTVKDETGAPMSGVSVVLSASGTGNTLTQPSGPTNASGVATGTLRSTVPELKTVSATANGAAITQTATVEVRNAPPTNVVTHTLLTVGNNIVNQKVYTTASISPAPNTLVTIAVLGHNSSAASPVPIISGGGMSSWTQVATITYDPLTLPLKRVTIYRAMSASPGTGPITITFANSQSHAQWIVSQWGGVDISGPNGSGAIVQTAFNASEAVNGMALTLAPFADENNVAFGVFSVRSSAPAVTPGAGFTEIAELGSGESPPSALQAEWMPNNNTISASWNNLRGAVLGIEIKAGTP